MREITSMMRRGLAAGVVALAMTVGLTSLGVTSASAQSVVGQSDAGTITSQVSGKSANGDLVKGSFTPTKFVTRDGVIYVKGFLKGVIVDAGPNTRFSGLKTFPVKKINGTTPTEARAGSAITRDVLNLVLGPLDLNVLGLEIHLNRVVLDIVAVTGAGNLLCAVVNLLNGGPLAGLLGQLTTLLNQILGALNLGI